MTTVGIRKRTGRAGGRMVKTGESALAGFSSANDVSNFKPVFFFCVYRCRYLWHGLFDPVFCSPEEPQAAMVILFLCFCAVGVRSLFVCCSCFCFV